MDEWQVTSINYSNRQVFKGENEEQNIPHCRNNSNIFPRSEMMRPCKSLPHVSKMPTLIYNWGPGWLNELRRGFAPDFVNYKKGALDSQPQVIKFTSCLPMVGGSLRLLPPLKLVAMILLKVALKQYNILTLYVIYK
jgi:hypothetical protein